MIGGEASSPVPNLDTAKVRKKQRGPHSAAAFFPLRRPSAPRPVPEPYSRVTHPARPDQTSSPGNPVPGSLSPTSGLQIPASASGSELGSPTLDPNLGSPTSNLRTPTSSRRRPDSSHQSQVSATRNLISDRRSLYSAVRNLFLTMEICFCCREFVSAAGAPADRRIPGSGREKVHLLHVLSCPARLRPGDRLQNGQ